VGVPKKNPPGFLGTYRVSEPCYVAGKVSALMPTSFSQPVTVPLGYIGFAHWAELIRPQRWAGVITCPPRR